MGKTMRHRGKTDYWRFKAGTSRAARERRSSFDDLIELTTNASCPTCGERDQLITVTRPVMHRGKVVNQQLRGLRCERCRLRRATMGPHDLGKPADASAGAER